jgi:hypothetical protein
VSILIIAGKVFATLVAMGGVFGGIFYIYMAYKAPTHGTAVQSIAGIIVAGLCLFGLSSIW